MHLRLCGIFYINNRMALISRNLELKEFGTPSKSNNNQNQTTKKFLNENGPNLPRTAALRTDGRTENTKPKYAQFRELSVNYLNKKFVANK